jgi:hypothetical protein
MLANPKSLSAFDGRQGASAEPASAKPQAAVAPSADPAMRARENLIHVLLNHNEFVTIR